MPYFWNRKIYTYLPNRTWFLLYFSTNEIKNLIGPNHIQHYHILAIKWAHISVPIIPSKLFQSANRLLACPSNFEGIIGTEIRMTKLHGQSAIMLEVVRFCHFLKRFYPLYRLRGTVILDDMYHVNYFKNCKPNISFQLLLTCFEVPLLMILQEIL